MNLFTIKSAKQRQPWENIGHVNIDVGQLANQRILDGDAQGMDFYIESQVLVDPVMKLSVKIKWGLWAKNESQYMTSTYRMS